LALIDEVAFLGTGIGLADRLCAVRRWMYAAVDPAG
jgi:hypothetical protein